MLKNLFYYLLTATVTATILSCSTSPLESLSIIEGTWRGEQEGNLFIEEWEKVSETEYKGHGTVLAGYDTVFKEVLAIQVFETIPYYIANPNNTGAVHFKLVEEKDNVFTFEKKDHDFPQQIIYSFKGKDSLLVQLLGVRDKEKVIEQLYFQRVK